MKDGTYPCSGILHGNTKGMNKRNTEQIEWISEALHWMKKIKSQEITYCVITFRRRQWQPTPVLLPGKSHGRRSLVGCSPWSREESDTTEQFHFPFSLSCIGEGNGNSFSILAWRTLGMGEPGVLPSVGSHRVRHDWGDLAAAAAACFIDFWSLFTSGLCTQNEQLWTTWGQG